MLWQLRSNKTMYYYCILNHWIFFLFSVVVLFLLLVLFKAFENFYLITLFIFLIYFFITGFLWFCGLFSLIFAVACFSHCSLLLQVFCNMWNIFLNFCLPLPSCSFSFLPLFRLVRWYVWCAPLTGRPPHSVLLGFTFSLALLLIGRHYSQCPLFTR